jgi:hypothetical protein
MVKLEVIDTPNNKNKSTKDHFLISADEPMRVEVMVGRDGSVVATVYKGHKIDMEQEPLGSYDSNVGPNDDWQVR